MTIFVTPARSKALEQCHLVGLENLYLKLDSARRTAFPTSESGGMGFASVSEVSDSDGLLTKSARRVGRAEERIGKDSARRLKPPAPMRYSAATTCRTSSSSSGFVIVGEEGWQRLVAFAVRRRLVLLDQAQRFGQPAAIGEQTFGLLRHVAFLQMVDELSGAFARTFAHRGEDARLRYAAEIVLNGRAETHLHHVEARRAPADPPRPCGGRGPIARRRRCRYRD